MKKKIALLLLLALYPLPSYQTFNITSEQAQRIGKKIWHNECNGTIEGLVSWNNGEQFASLGMGHFIWYPNKQKKVFHETFPSLLAYLQTHHKKIPAWLKVTKQCPWQTRAEFLAAKNSKEMIELRTLLSETIDLQFNYIIEQLEQAITKFKQRFNKKKYAHIKKQFNRLIQTAGGLYTLVDYANFKGVGFNEKKAYNNQGWGLIQVLEDLKGTALGKSALEEFASSAKKILALRVKNSPPERNEQKWLPGWFNRIDTYTKSEL